MPSLKAWLQGTGAPAHLQLVQRPLGQHIHEGGHASVADLVAVEAKPLQGWERPAARKASTKRHSSISFIPASSLITVSPQHTNGHGHGPQAHTHTTAVTYRTLRKTH